MNILIVDDEAISLEIMCDAVKELGHNYWRLNSPVEALKYLSKADMVLMDWEMPGMSGLDFVKAARVHGVDIPVIMVTVKQDYESLHKAMDAGADDFISKPIRVNDLMVRISEAAKKLDSSDANRPANP